MIKKQRNKSGKHHNSQKNIKYLGVALTKEVKDFNKNFKTLKKETEEDSRKQKDLPCTWIGRINIIKTATSLNV